MNGDFLHSLSQTLQAVARSLSERPCTAAEVIQAILLRHKDDYGRGRAWTIAETLEWPAGLMHRRIEYWLTEASSMIVASGSGGSVASAASDFREQPELESKASVRITAKGGNLLDGRAAILGVALTDRVVGRELVRAGLFSLIAGELGAGLVSRLTPRGQRRLATIPLAAGFTDVQPVVLLHEEDLRGAALSPDGRRALTYARGLVVWNMASRLETARLQLGQPVRTARFGADGRSVVVLLDDQSVFRWSTSRTDHPPERLLFDPEARSGALSRDATTVVLRYRRPEKNLQAHRSGRVQGRPGLPGGSAGRWVGRSYQVRATSVGMVA